MGDSAQPRPAPPAPADGRARRRAHEPLLERDDELARIDAALAEAQGGHGVLLVVEGPAGIGKTALLAAARTAAAERSMQVLSARGTELERDFAYGVVRRLFEAPLAEASGVERAGLLEGDAGAAAGLLGLPGAPAFDAPRPWRAGSAFAILHGLYWLCAGLAARTPLCIVVDDAHWVDAPSLRFLAYLIARLDELEVALVVAARSGDEAADAGLLAAVTGDASAEAVRLPPLTRAAVAELVESTLGGSPDPAFVDACLRATRGSPFLVRGLLDALRESGTAPAAEAARHVERIGARTVARSLRLQLRRLPDDARRLARAVAVLEQGDLLTAARVAGQDEVSAASAVDRLVTAGVLEPGRPLRFVHPIVRSAVYSDLTDGARAQGHRAAARLLADLPGATESVAEHLLASDPAADPWVVERLTAAACTAARNGAPESAAVFLRRALAEPPAPAELPRLLLELGTAEESAGLDGWLEHLQAARDRAPDAVAAARAAGVLARALNRAQRVPEAVDVLDRAAAAIRTGDPDLAQQLEAAAVVIGMSVPAVARATSLRRTALRERAGDPGASPDLLAVASFTSILTNEPADVGASLARRALSARDDTRTDTPDGPLFSSSLRDGALLSLLWAERYAEVQPLLDASIAEARSSGDGARLAAALANRAALALRRGDLDAAETDARTALAATEVPTPPLYRALNGGVLVTALVDRGDLDGAEQALEPLHALAEGESITSAALRVARGRLRVEQGRIEEGLADFLAVGGLLTRAKVSSPGYVRWRSHAALAQLALGDREAASRLAGEELELALAFGAPRTVGLAKRAAGLVAGGDSGASLLRDAVADLGRADAELERARALADLGALLRRRNRRVEARELLREALDAAHRLGARRLAEQAETELRATGARPRRALLTGPESLTASERRVAELAGRGLTNREIAQLLFVTARTVEGHLTSVFRKLRVDSRTDLSAALSG